MAMKYSLVVRWQWNIPWWLDGNEICLGGWMAMKCFQNWIVCNIYRLPLESLTKNFSFMIKLLMTVDSYYSPFLHLVHLCTSYKWMIHKVIKTSLPPTPRCMWISWVLICFTHPDKFLIARNSNVSYHLPKFSQWSCY